MKTKSKNLVTISACIKSVEEQAQRSHALWRSVNFHILKILKSRKSRAEIARRLHAAAGPKKKGEPVCLVNYRSAAKSIERGELIQGL